MNRPTSLRPLTRALAAGGLMCASLASLAQTAAEPAAAAPDAKAQTIVVTAQKRAQNVKEVPLAVTVVGAEQLDRQGIRDIGDLARAAASLEFGDQKTAGPGGSASIRGIGTAVFTPSAESSVGLVVDGVPLGNTAGGALFDLERVEVLRGPQGTLFGKNASAGVLNLSTKAPVLRRFEGSASLELAGGEATSRVLRGAVNVPINDMSAVRVTAHVDRLQGVIENVFSGRDSTLDGQGLRARYLLKPNADLTLNVIAEHDVTRGRNAVFFVPVIAAAQAGNHQPAAEFAACGVTVSLDNNRICSDEDESSRVVVQGLSAQADWTMPGGLTLTSITAWRERNSGPERTAIDMSLGYDKVRNFGLRNDMRQVSQELRLASPSRGALEWTAGFFYADYDALKTNTTTITPPPYLPSPPVPRRIATTSESEVHITTMALFGQASLKLGDGLSALAGLRFTRDRVSDTQTRTQDVTFANFGLPTDVRTGSASASRSNVSGKVGLQYALDRSTNLYATLTRGYKGPQIDNDSVLSAAAGPGSYTGNLVQPELPTSLELGAKATLLERRLDVDLAFFHTRIKNFQEQNCVLSPVGALNCVPLNVPRVTSYGLELDLRARVMPGLTLSASGAAILGTEYPTGFSFDGNDVGGQRLLYSPKGKLVLGAEYARAVMGDYEWSVGADVTYKTRVRYCNTLDESCAFKGHAIVGLRTGLRSPDDKWGVSLFVRNATDERVPNAILYPLPGKGAGSGHAWSLGANSFRAVGINADMKF